MIDLHTHTFLSDGILSPSELIIQAISKGYKAVAITDHCDYSNYKMIIPMVIEVCQKFNNSSLYNIRCIPGIELTYVLPEHIPAMIEEVRLLGAKLVVVHGETPVEPVPVGTNHAAIIGKADILAHPGLIDENDVQLAIKNNVNLEITSRQGHSLANGHLAQLVKKYDCQNTVIDTDSHKDTDLITKQTAIKILQCAGFNNAEIKKIFDNSEKIILNLKL
ncbi:MAG TPA: histidinol phosphate phosphatase domain-containing protein [bacterium]|nr:histidinol phosphate phosphatase domain-containing protein [bacterium]HOK40098.1 histidinol phosphate phosphatase domain-containing protein [bacterium]HOL47431.1 histidinol phosphate phosphatase domain-containing protein [bacterium]HPQ19495.1 histidinol phosphate phosphatase domain-containing protein [bacterium]HPQ19499.1 histidinol phosphate phosphatase domain-containing protein [bacterium]